MNTAVNMERIKVVVIRATYQAREKFAINGWDTHHKVFLSQDSIEIVDSYNVKINRISRIKWRRTKGRLGIGYT